MTNTTTTHICNALNTEWALLATPLRSRHHLTRWAITEPALREFGSFDQLCERITSGSHAESVALTQALIRLAEPQPMASRVLLQVMVPTVMNETYRSAAVCRSAGACIADADLAALVFGAATDAIASVAGTTIDYPLRNLHKRMVKRLIPRRERLITNARELASDRTTARVECAIAAAPEPSAAELLAATLQTAINQGIVTRDDAKLLWLFARHDQTSVELAGGDTREAERLRKRRTRARRKLIRNSHLLTDALAA